MDNRSFDAVTRSLARIGSRRALARAILAGAGAAIVSRMSVSPAAAKCKKPGLTCDPQRDRCCGDTRCKGGRCRCSGKKKVCRLKCIPKTQCCTDSDCRSGLTCCDGRCRDTQRDNGNCGSCGNECFISGSRFCACGICVFCPLGATLSQATCSCDCPDGQTNCGGICRDTCTV